MKNEYCVFIISHGRPKNVYTIDTLKKSGYTGDIILVLDNEDFTIKDYESNFPDFKIFVFDKKLYADQIDEGNNFDNRKTTTHARNACFDIAEHYGYEYFMVLDDDYTSFDYRLMIDEKAVVQKVNNLDVIFDLLLKYYKSADFQSIAFSQGGDYIGGLDNGNGIYRFSKRKCMNSFFCSIKKRFQFIGQLNEDVNTYVTLGTKGALFLTIPFVSLTQKATQKTTGGMTDAYLKYGTYCKAFTKTMMSPSSVSVSMMNTKHQRIHHTISWPNTTPMIIREKHKKI